MKKIFATLAAFVAVIYGYATPITPEQALSLARQNVSNQGMAMKMSSSAPMLHIYTMQVGQTPTLYVFAPQAEQKGFMLLAADDCVPVLLGYSDNATFDAEHIPDNVAYWMDQYSQYIVQVQTGKVQYQAPTFVEHPAIEPICKTEWSQSEPYNNKCPMVNGQRSVTGCVATALAQVLKTYSWPDQGTGRGIDNFGQGTATFNFNKTPFEWDKMLDFYYYDYIGTDEEREAVANLMLACGVASKMGYSPNGSGAQPQNAVYGLGKYFKYDHDMRYLSRAWYTSTEWDAIIYAELAQGYPLYYDGNDGSVGHAFVCDGYDSNQYYHINWGWGGSYNGYFLLANLYPAGQGTGGGQGYEGFNYGQGVICNLRPGGEDYADKPYWQTLSFMSPITTDLEVYPRNAHEMITIYGDIEELSGIYNLSCDGMINLTVGVELVGEDGSSQYIPGGHIDGLDVYYGLAYCGAMADEIPNGKWKMYPAFQIGERDYQRTMVPVQMGSVKYFDVVATDTEVTVSKPEVDKDQIITAALYGWSLRSSSRPQNEYNGTEGLTLDDNTMYTLFFQVTAYNYWNGTLYCLVYDEQGNVVLNLGSKDMTLYSSTKQDIMFRIKTADIEEDGKYYVGLSPDPDDASQCIHSSGILYYNYDPSGVGKLIIDEDNQVRYYNLQGIEVEHPTHGIYIKRTGTTVEKVIL